MVEERVSLKITEWDLVIIESIITVLVLILFNDSGSLIHLKIGPYYISIRGLRCV